MASYHAIAVGEPAPWFRQRSSSRAEFAFDTVAGRYIVLCFFGTAGDEQGQRMLQLVDEHRDLFDDTHAAFFGISLDPADEREHRIRESLPGVRFFMDFDAVVSRMYGAAPLHATRDVRDIRRAWFVLDPDLRVRAIFPAWADGSEIPAVVHCLRALPPVDLAAGQVVQAPVLILPDVLDAELCQRLMVLHQSTGGRETGFMREVDGKTTAIVDHKHKRRRDCVIDDDTVRLQLQKLVMRRVVPQIRKAFQFSVTRMERYIVACYDAASGGFFRAHRDNTTRGTAHRRFAVSVNLNDDFDGGEVAFPEYGTRTYRASARGAVVFSCSLLHAVTPVRRGRRYAFLPFLYDDAAAAVREHNNRFLADGMEAYSPEGTGPEPKPR